MSHQNSYLSKVQRLKDKITKEQQLLDKLQTKRKMEIGEIACKFELHLLNDDVLAQEFAKIAEQLSHVDAQTT